MVEVHMREDDVADVLRAVSKAGDLADGRLFRVERDGGEDRE
jgi:hypothetical protein